MISVKKIRVNVFETNSSSTNSLVIEDTSELSIPYKLCILDLGYDGRYFDYRTADEKFTVMAYLCDSASEFFGLCYKMYDAGVQEIVLPNPDSFKYLRDTKDISISCGEIDDSMCELQSLLDDENVEELKHFIFDNDSYISGEDDNY